MTTAVEIPAISEMLDSPEQLALLIQILKQEPSGRYAGLVAYLSECLNAAAQGMAESQLPIAR